MADKIVKTDADWKAQLTDEQFLVARKGGTERAFTGETWDNKKPGVYRCVCCGRPLFDAATKYDSGTGWPSFYQPINAESVETRPEKRSFSSATEVLCGRCDAHLGHVFGDGPAPTGQRFCMNSAAMKFEGR